MKKSSTIYPRDFIASLEKAKSPLSIFQSVAPLLLLEKEYYFKEKIISLLRPHYPEVSSVYADEMTQDGLDELFSGGGLFSNQPLIIIRQVDKINGGMNGAVAEKISHYIISGQATDLVLLSEQRSVSGKLLKAINETGTTITCWSVFDNQLPAYLTSVAREMGMFLDMDAAQVLIVRFGNNLTQLIGALEQTRIFLHSGQANQAPQSKQSGGLKVNLALVDHLFPSAVNADLFTLIDDILHGSFVRAMEGLHLFLESGQHLAVLLAMLAKEITLLQRGMLLLQQGMNPMDIAKELKLNRMKEKSFINDLQFYSSEIIADFLERLFEIDYQTKTTAQYDGRADIETAIFLLRQKKMRSA